MKRALVLGVWFPWSMALILASGLKSCDKPSPEVCRACLEHLELPGCAEVIKACQTPVTTTTTTTRPPDPTPTPTPTPIPIPTPTPVPTPVPTPIPTPTPRPICTGPLNASWSGPGPTTLAIGPMVNRVMSDLTGCSEGSDCFHGEGPGEQGAQRWMAKVNAELRKRGLCAVQHQTGITDEIAVNTACDGPFEGFHVANYGSGKVVWSPGAARPSWIPTKGVCSIDSGPTPTPTPQPTPTPGPTPTPTPVPGPTCPVTVGGDYYVDLHIGMIGHNPQQYTATAAYCGIPVRSDVFANCRSKCCTLGVDGGNQNAIVCEQVLSGVPEWQASQGLDIIPGFDGNPYNCKVTGGHGTLKACGKSSCSNVVTFP